MLMLRTNFQFIFWIMQQPLKFHWKYLLNPFLYHFHLVSCIPLHKHFTQRNILIMNINYIFRHLQTLKMWTIFFNLWKIFKWFSRYILYSLDRTFKSRLRREEKHKKYFVLSCKSEKRQIWKHNGLWQWNINVIIYYFISSSSCTLCQSETWLK